MDGGEQGQLVIRKSRMPGTAASVGGCQSVAPPVRTNLDSSGGKMNDPSVASIIKTADAGGSTANSLP